MRWGVVSLVAPPVFLAPRSVWAGLLVVPVGGGPPARRPRREPSARRVVSKPGQAPPPPTGTAARFSGLSGAMVGPSGALAFLFCCLWCRWCSGRRVACLVGRAAWCARGRRPARSPSAPRASLGASPRSPARPSHNTCGLPPTNTFRPITLVLSHHTQ